MIRTCILLGWLVAVGLAATSTSSCSGSGSNACSTPDPTSHLQTILTWDCDGRIRFLPDNPLFNINIDGPSLPRSFQAFLEGLNTYIKKHCSSLQGDVSWTTFLERYHPLNAFLYGNKLYKGSSKTLMNCLDNAASFTRDLIKIYESLTGKTSFEMPSSCPYNYWEDSSKCSFVHELMEISADIQVSVLRCETNQDFFKLYIGCRGPGCSVFKPCRIDEDCNAVDHLICTDPFNWVDPKIKGPPKFTESDVYEILRDTFRLYASNKDYNTETCKKYLPKQLFKTFVQRFAKYVVDSPEATTGKSSCETGPCKICLPTHTNAFESILSDFPGRWKEVTEENYPKSRQKADSDGCYLSPDRLAGNTTTGDAVEPQPTILMPIQPPGLYPSMTDKFATSPLAMGTSLYLQGAKLDLGGQPCSNDWECGTGICINNNDYCQIAESECTEQTMCEWDPIATACVPTVVAAADVSKKCACFILDKLTTSNYSAGFIYGKTCNQMRYIAAISSDSWINTFYTNTVHKWKGKYDPFIDWDGKAAADGIDPFTVRDHWKAFPQTQAPGDETHLASVQCNGVVHLFQNTPFALRIHIPMISDILQWWSDMGLETWKCRDTGVNQERYLISNALWRPEPWLFAKVSDKQFSTYSEPPGFVNTLTQWLFPTVSNSLTATAFQLWNYQHLVKFSTGFTLTDWFQSGKIGTSYTGMRGAKMDQDWSLKFRAAQCSSHPQGLVQYDLTCTGRSCNEMLLSDVCTADVDCLAPSKCLSIFTNVYDEDVVKQMLWGVERDAPHYLTDKAVCPALEGYGSNGMTSRVTTKEPVRDLVEKMWRANRYAGCLKRTQAECWRNCKWENGKCSELVQVPTVGTATDLKFCTPYLYPLYDALVTDMGHDSAIIGRPKTAGLYSLSQEKVHDSSTEALVFGLQQDMSDQAPPLTETTEDVDKPATTTKSATFGKSFIAVMLAMAIVVCIASMCVWYHYIRVTKEEQERVGKLHGLTFAFKQDTDTYGRDLMLPEMEKNWLPGLEEERIKKKMGKNTSAESLDKKEYFSDEEKPIAIADNGPEDTAVEMDELVLAKNNALPVFPTDKDSVASGKFSRVPSSQPKPQPVSESGSFADINGSFGRQLPARSPVHGAHDWAGGSANNSAVMMTGASPAGGRKMVPRVGSQTRGMYSPTTTGSPRPVPSSRQEIPIDDNLPPGPPPSGTRPHPYHQPMVSSPTTLPARQPFPNNLDFALSEGRGSISRGGPSAVGSAVDRYARRQPH